MSEQSVVAIVQVRPHVRRPVSSDQFDAIDAAEFGHYVRVRGRWRGHGEERCYSLPWGSIRAVRWLEGMAS
jgi:hypothetical protein